MHGSSAFSRMPVDDMQLVQMLQSLEDTAGQAHRFVRSYAAACTQGDLLAHVPARHELAHDREDAVEDVGVDYGHDVRVSACALPGLRFLHELRGARGLVVGDLDCDADLQAGLLFCAIHGPELAASEVLEELVLADDVTNVCHLYARPIDGYCQSCNTFPAPCPVSCRPCSCARDPPGSGAAGAAAHVHGKIRRPSGFLRRRG
jgi:hypothetical protein